MLGLRAGQRGRARACDELFGGQPQCAMRIAVEALRTLARRRGAARPSSTFDAAAGQPTLWYALSVRRTDARRRRRRGDRGAVRHHAAEGCSRRELELLARDRELMFSLSEVGIAFVRDGRIQRANEALAQLAGWPAHELACADAVDAVRRPGRATRGAGRSRSASCARTAAGAASCSCAGATASCCGCRSACAWSPRATRRSASSPPTSTSTRATAPSRPWRCRPSARARSSTRCWWASSPSAPSGIEWMNRSARRMFGGDLADFINQPIAHRGHARARRTRSAARTTSRSWSRARPRPSSAASRRATGASSGWSATPWRPARESTGRQLTYALLDIERRRQAEARMSEAQASLQRIIEAAPMAITLRDARTLKRPAGQPGGGAQRRPHAGADDRPARPSRCSTPAIGRAAPRRHGAGAGLARA